MADAPPSLQKVRAACKKRGATGAKGLSRAFRIYDDDRSQTLNYDEFKTGLEDYGVDNLSDEEFQELFSYFDSDGAGGININEFILAFRKPLEGSRLNVVKLAFKKADKTGDGVLTCDDLKKVYNAREHPKYKNGEYTEKQVFEEFLNNFEPENGKDGQVTEKEFIEYYSCLGANIDNDAYFDLMKTLIPNLQKIIGDSEEVGDTKGQNFERKVQNQKQTSLGEVSIFSQTTS